MLVTEDQKYLQHGLHLLRPRSLTPFLEDRQLQSLCLLYSVGELGAVGLWQDECQN